MDTYVIIFMGVTAIFALGSLIYTVVDMIVAKRNESDFD